MRLFILGATGGNRERAQIALHIRRFSGGCSRGLLLHGRWTRRGHIVHSFHSVRPTVTDLKEESERCRQ